ncbi:MAG: hypothetical protein ACOYYS_10825 [Chloroflexota bacterium]
MSVLYLTCAHCGRGKAPDRETHCTRCKAAYICQKNSGRIRRHTVIHYSLVEKPKEKQA